MTREVLALLVRNLLGFCLRTEAPSKHVSKIRDPVLYIKLLLLVFLVAGLISYLISKGF